MKQADINRIKAVEAYLSSRIQGKTRKDKVLRGDLLSALVDTMSFPSDTVEDLCLRGMDIETSTHYRRLRRFRQRCKCKEFEIKALGIMEEFKAMDEIDHVLMTAFANSLHECNVRLISLTDSREHYKTGNQLKAFELLVSAKDQVQAAQKLIREGFENNQGRRWND